MSSLRTAAQAVIDSLDKPDSAVERLRFAKLVATLRAELAASDPNVRRNRAIREAEEWAERNSPGASIQINDAAGEVTVTSNEALFGR